jgi:flagellar motor protein MotB
MAMWVWLVWMGCPRGPATDSVEGQCDREVIALKDHLDFVEAQLAKCSEGDAPNTIYPELKQVFSGSDVKVDKEGTATRLTVKVSTIYADPYQLKFRTEADPTVGLLATALQRHLDSRVMIVGHTNDRPLPPAYRSKYVSHTDWSARMAGELARRFVDQYGCEASQFLVAGRGEYSPVDSNDLETGRDLNQRLEIWVYPRTVADAPPPPD